MLDKKNTLYDRNSEGKLIPQEVKLCPSKADLVAYPGLDKETIMLTPMVRGEIKEMFNLSGKTTDTAPETDKDTDGELIIKHCIEPKYTAEDIKFMKPYVVRTIVRTIFMESGLKLDESSGTRKIEEDEFSKNSVKPEVVKEKAD